jgi:hypothetical protein
MWVKSQLLNTPPSRPAFLQFSAGVQRQPPTALLLQRMDERGMRAGNTHIWLCTRRHTMHTGLVVVLGRDDKVPQKINFKRLGTAMQQQQPGTQHQHRGVPASSSFCLELPDPRCKPTLHGPHPQTHSPCLPAYLLRNRTHNEAACLRAHTCDAAVPAASMQQCVLLSSVDSNCCCCSDG